MQVDLKDVIVVGIAVFGFLVSFYFGTKSKRRNDKCDDQQEASIMARMSAKLDFIGTDVTAIKTSINGMESENKETRERLVAVEQSTKQAHKRIDRIEGQRGKPPDEEV